MRHEGSWVLDRDGFVHICDQKVKLVRTEYGLTQERMSKALGISKKTLVEIEKGRRTLGWTASVALCSVFEESEILAGVFGGRPTEMIQALVFDGAEPYHPQTLGGKVWWTTIRQNDRYIIQQNMISQHYRLLTVDDRRIMSSFRLEDLLPVFEQGRDAS